MTSPHPGAKAAPRPEATDATPVPEASAPASAPQATPATTVTDTAATPPARDATGPVLSEQSPEDTDAAWGEYPDSATDRLLRDRPPHWDDF
jgi:hypothetical protein